MSKASEAAARAREIYLSLPDTKETITWGAPHMRVGDKIFGGHGVDGGKAIISFKLEMDHADLRVQNDPRFSRAPYVGHKGWVTMDVSDVEDWGEVRALIEESYRLIAPKKSLAKLGGAAPPPAKKTAAKKGAPKTAAKKTAAKKAPAKKTAAKKAPAKKTVARR
jgi:predicted DNA-binding protein (MmcQ/YjbR family)